MWLVGEKTIFIIHNTLNMSEITEIVNALLQKDPPIAIRDSLKAMFVAASREFPNKPEAEAGVIADHFLALDAMLESLEIWQEKHG